jgi:hypothetical protein
MLNDYVKKNNEKIAYRVIEDEAVVVNLKESTFHTLNPVGTFIWQQFNGKTAIESIIQRLADEFQIDLDTARLDCLEFINSLVEEDLISLSTYPVE